MLDTLITLLAAAYLLYGGLLSTLWGTTSRDLHQSMARRTAGEDCRYQRRLMHGLRGRFQ